MCELAQGPPCTPRHTQAHGVTGAEAELRGRRPLLPAPAARRRVAGGWTAVVQAEVTSCAEVVGRQILGTGLGAVGGSREMEFHLCPGRNETSPKALLTWQREATVPLFVSGVRTWVVGARVGPGATRRDRAPRPAAGTAAGPRRVLLGPRHSVWVEPPTATADDAACRPPRPFRPLFKTSGSFGPCKRAQVLSGPRCESAFTGRATERGKCPCVGPPRTPACPHPPNARSGAHLPGGGSNNGRS